MRMSPEEVALAIRSFVDGTAGQWDWDDFTSIPIRDRKLNDIRKYASAIYDLFPAEEPGNYCSAAGTAELTRIAAMLELGVDYGIDENGVPREGLTTEPPLEGRKAPLILFAVPFLEIGAILTFIAMEHSSTLAYLRYSPFMLFGGVVVGILVWSATRMNTQKTVLVTRRLSFPPVIALALLGHVYPGLSKDMDFGSWEDASRLFRIFCLVFVGHLVVLLAGRASGYWLSQ